MKKVFTMVLLIISLNNIYSIAGPKKDIEAGAFIGRAYLHLNKDWSSLPEGDYYDISLDIENKITKKKFTISTDNNGYFYKLNVPPGIYTIKAFNFQQDRPLGRYYIWDIKIYTKIDNKDVEGLNFGVHDKSIAVINTVVIYFEKYSNNNSMLSYTRVDEKDEIIKYFKHIDKENKWSEFSFGEYEEE